MSKHLKPCPFCGGTDIELSNTHAAKFWVECNDCQASAHGEHFEGPPADTHYCYTTFPQDDHEGDYHQLPENYRRAADSAIGAWNRRPPLASLDKQAATQYLTEQVRAAAFAAHNSVCEAIAQGLEARATTTWPGDVYREGAAAARALKFDHPPQVGEVHG